MSSTDIATTVEADRVEATGLSDAISDFVPTPSVDDDEQRVAVPQPAEREEPAEAADVADHLGPERRAHVRLDQLDRLLAGRDVDAGVGVRERLVAVGCSRRSPRRRERRLTRRAPGPRR